ncbi:cupin domain-containing protein [Luminiphilus sp.]|nr:cupin domain-containing protein [Luminiphilus sp.]MDC3404989.1 cupin domain-containing protein [Luminiphilus sp.]
MNIGESDTEDALRYMKLHADLTRRAVVNSLELDWLPSPMAGVHRRMLDRKGGEVARATSIVRYEPQSFFSSHTHSGGEEFLVLEGTFSDENGDYRAGTYVRNPVGSSHTPFSKAGSTIFVKLQQFHPLDQASVRVDTNTACWQDGSTSGITVLPLHRYESEVVSLVKCEPGVSFPENAPVGGEEVLVLDGALCDEFGHYQQGTWIRNPPGSRQQRWSQQGCLFYRKTGHLIPSLRVG